MRVTIVKYEDVGTGEGERRYTVDRSGLLEALTDAHPCDNYACDIATMQGQGFIYSAARMLQGATECEGVDRVMHALIFNGEQVGTHTYDTPDWDDWKSYHDEHGVKCECGAFNYGNDTWRPSVCANCLAQLPAETDD